MTWDGMKSNCNGIKSKKCLADLQGAYEGIGPSANLFAQTLSNLLVWCWLVRQVVGMEAQLTTTVDPERSRATLLLAEEAAITGPTAYRSTNHIVREIYFGPFGCGIAVYVGIGLSRQTLCPHAAAAKKGAS
eukprot:scaffold567795_cov52-Prasinocladus_malaysianus.AAC.1